MLAVSELAVPVYEEHQQVEEQYYVSTQPIITGRPKAVLLNDSARLFYIMRSVILFGYFMQVFDFPPSSAIAVALYL
jgi:hypothetical protein